MGSATTPTTVSTATMPTSMTDAEATRLGLKVYTIGTTYNSVLLTISESRSPVATQSAFIPYQMQNGSWRLKFSITYSISPTDSVLDVDISGVVFPYRQAIAWAPVSWGGAVGAGTVIYCEANGPGPGHVYFRVTNAVAGGTQVAIQADVALSSKPTWAY